MSDAMTPRRRWMAALRCEPVDCFAFWPKLNHSYPRAQSGAFRDMSVQELLDWIDCDPQLGVPECVKTVHHRTRFEVVRENGTMRTIYGTPHGELVGIDRYDEPSGSWHPREFAVKTVEDIDRLTAYYEDLTFELDPEALARARERIKEIGESGMPIMGIGISPLMHWLQHIAGIAEGHYLLADHTEKVETLFAHMHRCLVDIATILAEHAPVDAIYSTENTSTTLISPAMSRKYCVPHLAEYGRIITAGGKMHLLHMCGLLKDLLPDIVALPAVAVEAFTSPPVGNTTFADGRAASPDECFIGGTNAMLWLGTAREIIARLEQDLAELPHKRGLIPSSAGVMPPACNPHTIREVCRWLKAQTVE